MAGTSQAVSSGPVPRAPPSVRRSRPSTPAPVPQANAPRRMLRYPRLSPRPPPAVPPLRRTCLQASIRKSSRHTLSISAWNLRSGSSFAFACNTVWSFRTLSDPVRFASVVTPCLLPVSLSTQGPFPPPALPGFLGNTGPSATPTGPACPSRDSGWCVPHHRRGFPCCVLFPLSCMPAPIPRRERPVLPSLSSRPPPVFPFSAQGRLPHCPFRGLLGVHSRSGLHAR